MVRQSRSQRSELSPALRSAAIPFEQIQIQCRWRRKRRATQQQHNNDCIELNTRYCLRSARKREETSNVQRSISKTQRGTTIAPAKSWPLAMDTASPISVECATRPEPRRESSEKWDSGNETGQWYYLSNQCLWQKPSQPKAKIIIGLASDIGFHILCVSNGRVN